MRLIDLSQNIESGMTVYPGDSNVVLEHTQKYSSDYYNNFKLDTGMHVGTHIDGPMHMIDVNQHIGDLDLERFCGQGCIIHAQNENIIMLKEEYLDIINGKSIVLIHTGMDYYYGSEKYYSQHPVLDISLCQMLVKSNVKMIGIDMPSPDRYPFEMHKYLLSHNVLILENVTNLDKIRDNDNFEVMAFPLKIAADSCMVRAVAKIF